MEWQNQKDAEGLKYFWFLSPVTPYASDIPDVHRVFTEYIFDGEKTPDHYLELLRMYPAFMKNVLDRVREQYNRGIILPAVELAQVLTFLQSYQRPPEKSIFFVKSDRLASVTAQRQQKFQAEAASVIQNEVNPSLQALTDLLSGDYKSKAPAAVGLSQYPGGREAYKYLVGYHTTMDVTPEDVHEIGL